MPQTNPREMKTYLQVPCELDGEGEACCRYKTVSVLGCRKNPEVTSPDKCHHLIQFVNIGLIDPKYLDSEI